MKQNCDLCKVTSTSSSPPPPLGSGNRGGGGGGGVKTEKMKAVLDVGASAGDHRHRKQDEKGSVQSTKYLMSTKHCSVESPPLKQQPVTRTIPPSSGPAPVPGQQLPCHHLHPPQHHQFNGFDEYYSAPLLSPSIMMDMMLAAHLLRG